MTVPSFSKSNLFFHLIVAVSVFIICLSLKSPKEISWRGFWLQWFVNFYIVPNDQFQCGEPSKLAMKNDHLLHKSNYEITNKTTITT